MSTGHLRLLAQKALETSTNPAKLMVDTLNVTIASRFVGFSKEFTITTNGDPKALEAFVSKHNWIDQKSSDSYKEFVISTVLTEAAKSKYFKGKKPVMNTKASTASASKKISNAAPKKRSRVSLLTLLNAKLPEEVRKRMTYPRLVNRTGRFANSVRAVSETRTPKGFLSIAYTYQRSPYQVFERTLGRAPWNTPERDPRDLINESIRAIAASVMTERFFTRRV
jgi:hypothetical protein